ncbi:MAG TPA: DUF3224 domain-containing protein [Pseudonocardiaceae bacterium]|nr:DUF3224 domain-containing protein [Pseudonocardiaceae bacterium]
MTTSTESLHATGSFDLHDWQEQYYDEAPGAKLAKVSNRKTFHGDIEATSSAQLLTVGVPVEGANEYAGVAYVAIERITGTVHGRQGSFVLVHTADRSIGMSVSVVAGSADGELAGLGGEMQIARAEDGSHTYTFDYRFTD